MLQLKYTISFWFCFNAFIFLIPAYDNLHMETPSLTYVKFSLIFWVNEFFIIFYPTICNIQPTFIFVIYHNKHKTHNSTIISTQPSSTGSKQQWKHQNNAWSLFEINNKFIDFKHTYCFGISIFLLQTSKSRLVKNLLRVFQWISATTFENLANIW